MSSSLYKRIQEERKTKLREAFEKLKMELDNCEYSEGMSEFQTMIENQEGGNQVEIRRKIDSVISILS